MSYSSAVQDEMDFVYRPISTRAQIRFSDALLLSCAIAAFAWMGLASVSEVSEFEATAARTASITPPTTDAANPYGTLDGMDQIFASIPSSVLFDTKQAFEMAFTTPTPPSSAMPQRQQTAQQTARTPSPIQEARLTPAPDSTPDTAPLAPLPPTRPRDAQERDAQENTPLPPQNPFRPNAPAKNPPAPARQPQRQIASARVPAAATPPVDNRGFFEKLFGAPAGSTTTTKTPRQALAYARTDDVSIDRAPPRNSAVPLPANDEFTAVYDIEARVVYLPNGTRLEAHSGLGGNIDDPSSVHLKMRGVTPTNVYNLTLREKLFHGVRAIRLNPVDPHAMHGRDGILAHTFMLGPRGDSNGCVSFRDYSQFLNAFLRGEVKRLVVVARGGPSAGSQALRSFASRG